MKKFAISLLIMLTMAFSAVAEAYDASADISFAVNKSASMTSTQCNNQNTQSDSPSQPSHKNLSHLYSAYSNIVSLDFEKHEFITVMVGEVAYVVAVQTPTIPETLRYSHYDVFDTYPHTPPPHLS